MSERVGVHDAPALTMFMWESGAVFETVLNIYTSSRFPAGIDPRAPGSMQIFQSVGSNDIFNGSSRSQVLSALQPGVLNDSLALVGSTPTTAIQLGSS